MPDATVNDRVLPATVHGATADCSLHVPPLVTAIDAGTEISMEDPLLSALARLSTISYCVLALAVMYEKGVTDATIMLPAVVVIMVEVVTAATRSLLVLKYICTTKLDMFLTLPGCTRLLILTLTPWAAMLDELVFRLRTWMLLLLSICIVGTEDIEFAVICTVALACSVSCGGTLMIMYPLDDIASARLNTIV